MRHSTGFYPRVRVDDAAAGLVSQAGATLLVRTLQRVGIDTALQEALRGWRRPSAVHDPGKVILDLALTLAVGGDCLADVAQLRVSPGVFGAVASDATVSRVVAALAAARAEAWRLAGRRAPDHDASPGSPVIIDLDATLVTAHSEKEQAAPTFKRGFGFHPLCAFVDHGAEGTGEPLAVMLRAGNARSNTAPDHIALTRQALRQLPSHVPARRPGPSVLVRTDGAGGTHEYVSWLVGQRVQYSVGFSLPTDFEATLKRVSAWSQAYDAEGQLRPGAFVAEITGMLELSSWPEPVRKQMRVIIRKEKPHPGAQLRIYVTDLSGDVPGVVRHLRIEESEHPIEFVSLVDMLKTVLAGSERKVFFVDPNGYLEMDDLAFATLSGELNPRVPWWVG